jgi:hypothetical protein
MDQMVLAEVRGAFLEMLRCNVDTVRPEGELPNVGFGWKADISHQRGRWFMLR